MSNRKRVLLLNADLSVLTFVTLGRAVGLFLNGKIRVVDCEEDSPRIHPSVDMRSPNVIALNQHVYVPFRKIRVNKKNVLSRDDYICQYCGRQLNDKTGTVDHVIPKSHPDFPGHDCWTNVAASCSRCNNKKGNILLAKTGMTLRGRPFQPKIEDLMSGSKRVKKILDRLRKPVS